MSCAVAAIVLAAGESRRLGQPKQLVTLDGETLLERAIRMASDSGAAPVLAVLGAHRDAIGAAISPSPAGIVVNTHWSEGIATSIHAGIRAVGNESTQVTGALLLTCDQPRLTADHLRTLVETFTAHGEEAIVASAYAGVVGIPAVFPRQAFANLLALEGDKGARALLANPPCPLIAVPFAGGEVDIDEPADLAQLDLTWLE